MCICIFNICYSDAMVLCGKNVYEANVAEHIWEGDLIKSDCIGKALRPLSPT